MHNHDLTGGNEVKIVKILYLSLHEPRYVLLATSCNNFVIFCCINQELQ